MKTVIRFFTIFLLFFCSVSGLFGGGAFLLEPSGKLLLIPTTYLEHSPFKDFLIPGIVLFTFIGISSIVVAVFVMTKKGSFPKALLFQGAALVIFIVVEVISIHAFDVLQAVYFIAGVYFLFAGIYLKPKMA